MKTESARSMTTAFGRHTRKSTTITRWLTASALLLALLPSPAHAQLGRFKKLKEKFNASSGN